MSKGVGYFPGKTLKHSGKANRRSRAQFSHRTAPVHLYGDFTDRKFMGVRASSRCSASLHLAALLFSSQLIRCALDVDREARSEIGVKCGDNSANTLTRPGGEALAEVNSQRAAPRSATMLWHRNSVVSNEQQLQALIQTHWKEMVAASKLQRPALEPIIQKHLTMSLAAALNTRSANARVWSHGGRGDAQSRF